MKKIILICFILSSVFQSNSQELNIGGYFVNFPSLIKSGVTYLRTGDAVRDSIWEKALKDSWTCSAYGVIEESERSELDDGVMLIGPLKEDKPKGREMLAVIRNENLVGNPRLLSSRSTMIHYWFPTLSQRVNDSLYLPMCVATLDQMLNYELETFKKIPEKDYEKVGKNFKSYFIDLFKEDCIKESVPLKNKTLLIMSHLEKYVSTAALDKSGIKWKVIGFIELRRLMKEGELEDYCFFNRTYTPDWANISSVFDFSSKKLIYYNFSINSSSNLNKREIGKIVESWD